MEMAQETNQKEDPKLVAVPEPEAVKEPEPEVPDEGEKVPGEEPKQPGMNVKQVTEEEVAANPELGALAAMAIYGSVFTVGERELAIKFRFIHFLDNCYCIAYKP